MINLTVKPTRDEILLAFRHLFLSIQVNLYPDDDAINGFFTAITIEEYPEFFETCLRSGGSGNYNGIAGFARGPQPAEIDWPTSVPALPDNQVTLGGQYFGGAIIPVNEFLEIALCLAREVLKAAEERKLMEREVVNEAWVKSIQSSIPKMEAALAAMNED